MEVEREQTCCFTGHRSSKLPWHTNEGDIRCVELKRKLREALREEYEGGIRHFICGMASGSDMYFAEAVLRLLAAEFDPGEITLSLMRQYTPGFAPLQYRELSRCVTSFEYEFALDLAGELGFSGFSQEKDSASCAYTPDFAGKGGEVGKNFG